MNSWRNRRRTATSMILPFLSSRAAVSVHSFQCRPPKARVSITGSQCCDTSWTREDAFGRDELSSAMHNISQAAIIASALLFRPISSVAIDGPSPLPPSTAPPIMGSSIVFDALDEAPPIEEAVMRGSTTTVVKLREVDDERCKVKSTFGDVLEIDYVAKRLAPPVEIYDASIFRGTGQPFKFVLGSGVMIPGVDMGLYKMCPGEVRLLKVPPKLAVGLLDPPAKAPLEWRVELVSIDGIIRVENNNELTREERNMMGAE